MPAVAREASYIFEHDPLYSGASYHGMWLQGKPHGQYVNELINPEVLLKRPSFPFFFSPILLFFGF